MTGDGAGGGDVGDGANEGPPDGGERARTEYSIHIAKPPAGQTRVLKQDEAFGVFDRYGDIHEGGLDEQGLFLEDTRFLSRSLLLIDGNVPLLLSSTITEDNGLLSVDLSNPELDRAGGVVPQETVHLRRTRFLWLGTCFERIAMRNYGLDEVTLDLEYLFDADFEDVFEIRGLPRSARGERDAERLDASRARLRYRGLDGRTRATTVAFSPPPAALEVSRAQFAVTLAPGAARHLDVTVSCVIDGLPAEHDRSYEDALADATVAHRAGNGSAATVASSNELFNDWIDRSRSDLAMMTTRTDDGPMIYAGVPWFSAAFGRDSLIVALEVMWSVPECAENVLRFLAATQADGFDEQVDAEPGKIVHEIRRGEMAALREVPFACYYGSVDATPLFVLVAAEHFRATADLAFARELWPHVERALEWIDRYGDLDGDGFVEYRRANIEGLLHQGWKDSSDSVFHADGSEAGPPIALCEVQAYVFAAKRGAATIARALGDASRAEDLEREAAALCRAFDEAFWSERLGTYVIALDGDGRMCEVRSSNAGHCLFAGIALPERADRVVEALMAPASFSGWGVRTICEREARYNPMSYHNGSVWPHDNAIIAMGLARYGFKEEATRILEGMFDLSQHVDLRRLPELICGFERRPHEGPTQYPVACSPQAWAAGAPFMLLQACLGLEQDAAARELRFDRPRLPVFIDTLTIEGLRIGDASVDLEFRRYDDDTGVRVRRREGDLSVVVRR